MADEKDIIRETFDKKYEYGFTTDVETEIIPTGLNEDVIRLISVCGPFNIVKRLLNLNGAT